MAYTADIQATNPAHHYPFDGDIIDKIAALVATNVGCILTDAAICEDATNCLTTNGVADTVTLATGGGNIEQAANSFSFGGWFTPTSIQQPPCMIFGENDTTRSATIFLGFGNNVMFEVLDTTFALQIYGDQPLVANRPYHLLLQFKGISNGNEFRAYIDGVLQTNSQDIAPGDNFNATDRTAGRFGGLDSGLAIGGTAMKLVSPIDGQFNHWAFWSSTESIALSATIVREELFEKGATPTVIITNQAGLDALADTARANSPLCIRVNVAGSISLTADNVTFDPLASIHIEYNGTGTLTWTNTNGSNATIGSTPNGGTIVFINPKVLTLTGLAINTEVRVFEAGTTTEIAGLEDVDSGSFVNSISASSIDIRIIAIGKQIVEIYGQDMTSDTTIIIAIDAKVILIITTSPHISIYYQVIKVL